MTTSELINQQTIQNTLYQLTPQLDFELILLDCVDSTNRFLKEIPAYDITQPWTVCVADTQTAGRGRFGRHWHSPAGSNIYCSIRYTLPPSQTPSSGLSIIIGLALIHLFRMHYSIDTLTLKWPNDLIWQGKKCGGILIEIIDKHTIIMGIGLNVNGQITSNHAPWCSLDDIAPITWDRNKLIAQLITHVSQYITQFNQQGLQPFLNDWHQADALYGKTIRAYQQQTFLEGRAHGIDTMGQLRLIDSEGNIIMLSSGEVSLSEPIKKT